MTMHSGQLRIERSFKLGAGTGCLESNLWACMGPSVDDASVFDQVGIYLLEALVRNSGVSSANTY